MFVKFIHKWSCSESEPEYIMLADDWKDSLKEYFDDMASSYYYNYDGYRGVEFEIINRPPQKWIDAEIKKAREKIRDHIYTIKTLSNIKNE